MVTVLLATYNGERYLREQLDSILRQTYKDFKILIHDDGSTDGTVAIINEYAAKFPELIEILDAPSQKGACANFALLFSKCDSDYIMFCDQDDVWFSEKIEKSISKIVEAEKEFGAYTPILVHGDLVVTDGNLRPVNNSFFAYQKLDYQYATLPHLLVQNCVTGCTVTVNRALKLRSGEIPKECAMHDWWLALIAASFGKIVFIEEPLIFYRQHENNSVGAKSASGLSYIARKLSNLGDMKSNYLTTYVQARILRQRFIKELPPEEQKIINAYCNMSELGKLGRIKLMRQFDFKKNTKLRVIGQYFII